MKYLVTMELVEPLPASLEGTLEHLQAMIIPSHEILAQMEQDKKIAAGGVLAGQRGIVLILEAASNAEVTQLLAGIPLWGSHRVEVTPLESFEERQALHRQLDAQLKALVE